MTKRMIVPLIFGLVGAAILVSLGSWQLRRLEWKEGVLAEIEARINDSPVALPAAPDPEADRFLAVQATGRFTGGQVRVLASVKQVGPGHRLIAAFETDGRRVLVDRGFNDSSLVSVTSDHRSGAEQVAEELLAAGHISIGLLQGLPGSLPNEERIAGFRDAMKRRKLPFDASLVDGDNFTAESGYNACLALMRERPDITAFFALSNQNALGALRALRELGLRVPDDISLVTFDDHPFSDFLAVPLTTACQDVQSLGRLASELLVRHLRTGRPPRKKLHRVPVRLIRQSSVTGR